MSAIHNVFGHDAKIHPFTKRPIEQGIGALSEEAQVGLHLLQIEQEHGKEYADQIRKAIADEPKRIAKEKRQAAEAEAAKAAHAERVERALKLLDEHEAAEAAKAKTKTEGNS